MTTPAFSSWAQFIAGGLLLGAVSGTARAQPANDNFADRVKRADPEFQVELSNVGASTEPNEPAAVLEVGGNSLWWEWTAPASGFVTASTRGSSFDTFLAVFVGDAIGALSPVASNDDEDLLGGIFTSRLSFFARQGTRYQIVVAGVGNAPGGIAAGDIRWQLAPASSKPLPAWELVTLDGERVTSSALPGKILIVDFWATWCAPCRAEIPGFIALQNRYRSAGLVILGVSVDTAGVAAVRAFADELKINYPLAMTTPALEQALGGVPSIPTAFILDSENKLIARHIGFREHELWAAEIRALLDAVAEGVSLQGLRSGDRIELSWPAMGSSPALQSASQIGSPWIAVPVSPDIKDGRAIVALPLTNVPAQFFRLVQPW